MDLSAKKIELLDWLMHLKDKRVLAQIEKLKEKFSSSENVQPIFGRLQGKIKIASDFDAPLNDFKEYLE